MNWGGRWESNPRPQEPQSCALPAELRPPHWRHRSGPPEWTRTTDLRIRSPLLCPAELQAGGSPLRGGMVGARGFEPPTPCAQGRCATRLRYTPTPRPLRLAKDPRFRTKGEYMFRPAEVSTCVSLPQITSRGRQSRHSKVNGPRSPPPASAPAPAPDARGACPERAARRRRESKGHRSRPRNSVGLSAAARRGARQSIQIASR